MNGQWALFRILIIACLCMTSRTAFSQLRDTRAVPGNDYLISFNPFYSGEYRTAVKAFRSAARGGVKSPDLRWVDAVCYDTMMGECFYHMGDLRTALESYNSALRIFLANTDWLKRLRYPTQVQPKQPARLSWGPPKRQTIPGNFPDTILSQQTALNAQALTQNNLIIQQSQLFPLRAIEILRCTALALARRNELLGPISVQDSLASQMERRLSVRTTAPNHWARPILDVPLGLAKAGAGMEDEALQILQRATASGKLDHPLTARALIEIGKLALKRDQVPLAANSFYEATFPAAQFDQYDELEEAFHLAAVSSRLSNQQFPALEQAATWLRSRRFRRVNASLLLSSAELAAYSGNANVAARRLNEARSAMARTDLLRSDIGVRFNYLSAVVNFSNRKDKAAAAAIKNVLAYQQTGSKRLFQIASVFDGAKREALTPRVASQLFGTVLRIPTARDWRIDPIEAFTMQATPLQEKLEYWMQIALDRNEIDKVIELADRVRQEKFFATLPLYGRLLSLRWVLEGPEVLMDDETKLQRQNLRNKFPFVGTVSGEANKLKMQLAKMPTVPPEGNAQTKWKDVAKRLAAVSEQQEDNLKKLALLPEPANNLCVPVRSLDQIQAGLQPGQAVMDIVSIRDRTYVILISQNKKYEHWEVKGGARIRNPVSNLLRASGSFDKNQTVSAGNVSNDNWLTPAQSLYNNLFDNRTDLWSSIQELIIVPDGVLWYLPFESLAVGTGNNAEPLISKVRIRYVPMASLAVSDPRQQPSSPATVVVAGRLFSRDMDKVFFQEAKRIASLTPESVVQTRIIPVGSGIVGHRWDRLVVIDDIEKTDAAGYGWFPAQADAKSGQSKLSAWLSLPFGSPKQLVFPGFHTAAAMGAKTKTTGDEMLLNSMAMLSAGSRTILLSRWRTGGRTSIDLVREFLAQLSQESASSAWQRSVQLTRSAAIDPDAEPRVKGISDDKLPKGEHPFFWAGYQLIDLGQPLER